MLVNSTIAGQMSGRLGGAIASHNRYGSYFRAGTIPVTSTTDPALAAKARFGQVSQEWQGLASAQQKAWFEWADTNPVRNRLGQQIRLAGNAAYIGLNTRMQTMGLASVATPPVVAAPPEFLAVGVTYDLGAGGVGFSYTPTPLEANQRLWLLGALTDSPGIKYVQNRLRLFAISAAAQASAYDFSTAFTARFGTVQVGQTVTILAAIIDDDNGQISGFRRDDAVVVST